MTATPGGAVPRLHGITNCDTVKRARAWLAERGAAHEFVDFKKVPPTAEQLRRWASGVGWERLLNRQGTTWRRLSANEQAGVGAIDGALGLMQVQPSLIKRPVVEWPDGTVTVGFVPLDWAHRCGVSAD